MKMCKTCPAYVDSHEDQSTYFGRSIGPPVCYRYGHVLGLESQPEEVRDAVASHYAESCPSYGEPINITEPCETEVKIAARREADYLTTNDETVRSCRNCKNCVSDSQSFELFGIGANVCVVKGTVITNPREEAKHCSWRRGDGEVVDASDLCLFDTMKYDFRIPDDVAVAAYVSIDTSTDPQAYKTDKKVSAAEKRDGIRAWRAIEDPTGFVKEPIMTPIFDMAKFTDEERELIPQTGDDEHPELYVDFDGLTWMWAVETYQLRETIALVGPPGTGKTEFGRHMAWLTSAPFRRINFSENTDPDDILGSPQLADGRTFYEMGRLPVAWQSVGHLMLDEPNTAQDGVWQTIRSTTEGASGQLVLDAAMGVICHRNRFCWPMMSMNPAHDAKNLGTRELAQADTNRLSFYEVGIPPDAIERKIIRDRCAALDGFEISDETLNLVMKIAKDIRAASADNDFHDFWGIRQQIKVARKMRYYPAQKAYHLASLYAYPQDVRDLVVGFISTHV